MSIITYEIQLRFSTFKFTNIKKTSIKKKNRMSIIKLKLISQLYVVQADSHLLPYQKKHLDSSHPTPSYLFSVPPKRFSKYELFSLAMGFVDCSSI